jgi:phosphonate transport system substrate-binding protein
MRIINYVAFILIVALLSCNEPIIEKNTDERIITKETKILKVGIVPQFSAKRILSIWSPILEELEVKTGYQFQIVGIPTIPEFEQAYEKGIFDIAYMNPYHSIVANKAQGYEAVLKDGNKQLFGVLVVKKEDPIQDIFELNGEKISFPSPNALGASLLMRTELKTSRNIDITPIYVNTHTNSYLSVLQGKTRAGGGVMGTFNELSNNIKSQLRIFYTTQETPPHPIVMHQRVDKATQQSIVKALLEIGKDIGGKVLLSKIPIQNLVEANQTEYKILEDLGMEDFYVKPE